MKKIVLGILAMLFIMPMAFAADVINTLPVEPGLTPESPFYSFDKLGESIQLAFTFNAQDKARLRLDIAEERLAELESLAKQNKYQYQNQLMTAYNNQLQFMEKDITDAEDAGQNMLQVRATVKTRTLAHSNLMGALSEDIPLEYQDQFKNAVKISSETQEQIGSGSKWERGDLNGI